MLLFWGMVRSLCSSGDLILLTKHPPGASGAGAADNPIMALVESVERDEANREQHLVQALISLSSSKAGQSVPR